MACRWPSSWPQPRLRLFSIEDLRDRLSSRLDRCAVARATCLSASGRCAAPSSGATTCSTLTSGACSSCCRSFRRRRSSAVEQVAAGLEAVREIDIVGCLASLVDKSMLRATDDGHGQRLTMLELIREYSAEKLAADPQRRDACRAAHTNVYVEIAADLRPSLRGPRRAETIDGLASELGNLKVAWAHLVELGDKARLTILLDPLWSMYEARGWYHGLYKLSNDLLEVMSISREDASTDDEVTLRLVLARSLMAVRGYTGEVEALYNQALELVESSGSPPPKRLPVLRSLASFHLYRGESDKAIAIGRKLLAIAEQAPDQADSASLAVEGHLLVGPNVAFMGNGREGLEHLEAAIRLYDPTRDGLGKLRLGPNPGVAAHAVLALLRWVFGYPATADRLASRVLELGRELGHPYSQAYGTFHVAVLNVWAEQWEAADRHAAEALAIARDNDYRIWEAVALVVGGLTESTLRDRQTGLAMTEQGIALYEDLRTPPIFWPLLLSMRGQAIGRAGRNDEALVAIEQAMAIGGSGPTTLGLNLAKADVHLALGDKLSAEVTLWGAYDSAHAMDLRMIELQASQRLVRLPATQRDPYPVLSAVIESFEEGRDTPLLVDAAQMLAAPTRV